MQQATNRRRTPIIALGLLLALSAGAGAIAIINLEPFEIDLDAGAAFQRSFAGPPNTGFTIRGVDRSPFTLAGAFGYSPTLGLQPDETVQEGFVLLDGTLALAISALKPDNTRARTLTTYRFGIRRSSLNRFLIRDA